MILAPKPSLLKTLPPGHLVLEASAGTGKTYALEHLVAELLLVQGLKLEEILVVTFTEKAAQELKQRVRMLLEKLRLLEHTPEGTDPDCAWSLDEGARTALEAALAAFETATIATIHGFCQRVLQESAFESGRLLRQEQASGEAIFEQAFQALMRERFAVEPPFQALLGRALAAGKTPSGIQALLWEAAREHGALEPSPLAAREALDALAAQGLESAPVLEELAALKVAGASRTALGKQLELLRGALADWRATGDEDAFWTALLEGRSKLEKQLPHLLRPEASEGVRALGARLTALARHAPSLEARLVQRLLPAVAQRMRELKETQGLFDFDDMILNLRDALRGPAGASLRARLRARYRVALIDEFQDTDGGQWEIFRTLFLEAPQRLVLVGDPKQAIYGFRGGDLPTYLRACGEALAGAAPQVLDVNYRSTEPMVRACNRILEADFFSGAQGYEHPVRCGKPELKLQDPAGRPLPPVRLLTLPGSGGAALARRRVARALVRELQDFLACSPRLGDRPLDWGDVFVLTGTATEGQLVGEALREAGVPHAYFKQEGLFQTPEASWVLDLLQAVAHPLDAGNRARSLLTPFFGLSIEALAGLSELSEEHPAMLRLQQWAQLARGRRFAELLHRILEETGILRRLLLTQEGDRTATNLLHILECLQEQAQASHQGFEGLVATLGRWVQGQEKPGGEGGDLQRLEGQRRAVQILTMHKSKGLEAPVVALFGGLTAPRARKLNRFTEDGQRRTYLGALPEALKEAVKQEVLEEDQRLLYVAITRAKARLILPCFVGGGSGKGKSFDAEGHPTGRYRTLNQRLVALAGDPDFEAVSVEELLEAGPLASAPSESLVGQAAPAFAPEPDYGALKAYARPLGITSFTGLQHRMEAEGDPEPSSPALALPPGALPAGSGTGILLHGILELVDLETIRGRDLTAWSAQPEVSLLIEEQLRLAGLPPAWKERVASLVHAALTQPLGLPGGARTALAELDPARVLRELRFLQPFPESPDFLTGSLDVLFEHGGRAYVLDWKSNLLPAYGPEALETCVQEHYELQVRIYTLAALAFLGIRDGEDYDARFGGVLYVFLRGLPGEGLWSARPAWNEVLCWWQELAEMRPFP